MCSEHYLQSVIPSSESVSSVTSDTFRKDQHILLSLFEVTDDIFFTLKSEVPAVDDFKSIKRERLTGCGAGGVCNLNSQQLCSHLNSQTAGQDARSKNRRVTHKVFIHSFSGQIDWSLEPLHLPYLCIIQHDIRPHSVNGPPPSQPARSFFPPGRVLAEALLSHSHSLHPQLFWSD